MYRVIAITIGAFSLAACSSTNLDALKPAPSVDSVQFESQPPGAEAKVSNGQTCTTPCALALPTDAPLTVTFSLNGYNPDQESLEPLIETGRQTKLQPNPIRVELTAAAKPAVKKPTRKRAVRKPAARKPAAPKPAAEAPAAAPAAPAPPPMIAAPEPQQPAPWPAPPKQ